MAKPRADNKGRRKSANSQFIHGGGGGGSQQLLCVYLGEVRSLVKLPRPFFFSGKIAAGRWRQPDAGARGPWSTTFRKILYQKNISWEREREEVFCEHSDTKISLFDFYEIPLFPFRTGPAFKDSTMGFTRRMGNWSSLITIYSTRTRIFSSFLRIPFFFLSPPLIVYLCTSSSR